MKIDYLLPTKTKISRRFIDYSKSTTLLPTYLDFRVSNKRRHEIKIPDSINVSNSNLVNVGTRVHK